MDVEDLLLLREIAAKAGKGNVDRRRYQRLADAVPDALSIHVCNVLYELTPARRAVAAKR